MLAFVAAPVAAQSCPELVGRWPYSGAGFTVVSGDHLYFGAGFGLTVAELSDRTTPQKVGEVVLSDFAQEFVIAGGYAYVADGLGGLRVVDVSDPTAPVEVGFAAIPAFAYAVALADGYAYVGAWESGLRVIDVSDPAAPVEVGFVDTPGFAYGVAVADGYAYVADEAEGLRVVDVSDPSTPVEVAVLDTPSYAIGVTVAGGYAYVSDYESGLRVVDISDPTAPVEVGFVNTPGESWQSVLAGGYLYLADGSSGLRVFDMSAPVAPVEVGAIDTPDAGYAVAVAGDLAYVGDGIGGVRVIDVATPSAPVEVGVVPTPGSSEAIAVAGGYAYVGHYFEGLSVLDVSEPSAPVAVGFVDTPAYSRDVAVAEGFAYVANDTAGLRVIDVRAPSAPVEVGFVDTPGSAWGVAVGGGYAYVADYRSGLRVIDVSVPSAPVEVGFVATPSLAYRVALAGRYAFVADVAGGLRVIDVSVPTAPVEVGVAHTRGTPYDVALSGRYAYVACGITGLVVVDVSTPTAPVQVAVIPPPDVNIRPWRVAIAGSYAYLTWKAPSGVPDAFSVIDVATPSAPVELTHDDYAWMEDVAVSAGHVFVAAGTLGVHVFGECGAGPAADGRESFVPAAAVAAGAEGAFFQTDLELNNSGAQAAEVVVGWLPRGEDNSEPVASDPITLAPGQSVRFDNVLTELFGLGPDSVGALRLVATTEAVIGMSRTYNVPAEKAAGTFGQGLAAVRATELLTGTAPHRIICLSEDADARSNVGCVNGTAAPVRISIGLYDATGALLETRTMDLGPYSNNQLNRIFRSYQPLNGTVEVWADSDDARYYCYGSMLDNLTSDPTTLLPQLPSADMSFIPAAALAAGLEGAFFTTDVDLSNIGTTPVTYELLWLPRGADNSEPVRSATFSLVAGAGVRYGNVLGEVFGLAADQVGAVALEASSIDLLAMSRTYNQPPAKAAGTFGQELPGIPWDRMMATGEKRRIIFMNETDDVRSNVGCQNGSGETVRVFVELFDAAGASLETKTMDLAPLSNNQLTRVFRNHAPVEAGYVDVWTTTPHALIYCYGSVLDNVTSDPTTVLPQ